jgi:ATP-dependent Clp protease ATP-binding subunit ClpX
LLAEVEANEAALRLRQDELESQPIAAPAANSEEAAGKARYLLNVFAARRMRSIMESILLDTMFDLPGVENVEVVISKRVVEGISPALYIYADVLRVGDADASA